MCVHSKIYRKRHKILNRNKRETFIFMYFLCYGGVFLTRNIIAFELKKERDRKTEREIEFQKTKK